MVVMPSADLSWPRAITFAAVGTAGQRCTTLRRLIVHRDVAATLLARLEKIYASVRVGDPLEDGVLVGPLVDRARFEQMQNAWPRRAKQGGTVHGGERECQALGEDAWYARPALVRMPAQSAVVQHETFAPILYVLTCTSLEEAIALQNGVPQGLSSAIFTTDLREAERFLQHGQRLRHQREHRHLGRRDRRAFGGEKTGGGRESGLTPGRATCAARPTPSTTATLSPLAQGVRFDV